MIDVRSSWLDAIEAENKDSFIRAIDDFEVSEKPYRVGYILRHTIEAKSTEDLIFVLDCVPYDKLSALMDEINLRVLIDTVLQTAAHNAFYAT